MRLVILLTYWYFKIKARFFHISYIQGTRIPLDYPKYMFIDISGGQEVKFLTKAEQLQKLKEIYNEEFLKELIPDGTKLIRQDNK